jgi:hypothetical protein
VNIRFNNGRIDEVFSAAYTHSTTFRWLIDRLERSDRFVYIDEGRCRHGALRSCLNMMTTPGGRHLLIRIDPRLPLPSVSRQLAHELYHAAEVAGAANVVDSLSLRRLFERIGFQTCVDARQPCWETREALAIEARVARDVTSSGSPRAAANALVGTWKLNLEKSRFVNTPPVKASTWVVGDRDDDGFTTVSTDTVTRSGGRLRVSFVFDEYGRDYPAVEHEDDQAWTVAVLPFDPPSSFNFVLKQDGATITAGRWTVGRDGRSLMVAFEELDADGHAGRSIAYFDRVN